jgi:hypothetical protein
MYRELSCRNGPPCADLLFLRSRFVYVPNLSLFPATSVTKMDSRTSKRPCGLPYLDRVVVRGGKQATLVVVGPIDIRHVGSMPSYRDHGSRSFLSSEVNKDRSALSLVASRREAQSQNERLSITRRSHILTSRLCVEARSEELSLFHLMNPVPAQRTLNCLSTHSLM